MRQITTPGLESEGEWEKRRSQGSSRTKREGQVCSFPADRLGEWLLQNSFCSRFPVPQDEHEGSCFCHQILLSNDVQAPPPHPSSLQKERKKGAPGIRRAERRTIGEEGQAAAVGEQKGGPAAGGGEPREQGGVAPICPAGCWACRSLSHPLSWAIGPAP